MSGVTQFCVEQRFFSTTMFTVVKSILLFWCITSALLILFFLSVFIEYFDRSSFWFFCVVWQQTKKRTETISCKPYLAHEKFISSQLKPQDKYSSLLLIKQCIHFTYLQICICLGREKGFLCATMQLQSVCTVGGRAKLLTAFIFAALIFQEWLPQPTIPSYWVQLSRSETKR